VMVDDGSDCGEGIDGEMEEDKARKCIESGNSQELWWGELIERWKLLGTVATENPP
jgi:hypothetical protein